MPEISDQERIEVLEDRLHRIAQWCKAYPEDVFIPVSSADISRADDLLRAAGISMSAMHAQWARQITHGIGLIAEPNTEDSNG